MNFSYSFENKENIYSSQEESVFVPLGVRCTPRLVLDQFIHSCQKLQKLHFKAINPCFFNYSFITPLDIFSVFKEGFESNYLPTNENFFSLYNLPPLKFGKERLLFSLPYNFWFKVDWDYKPNEVIKYYKQCSHSLKTHLSSNKNIYFLIINQEYLTSECWRTECSDMFFNETLELDKKFKSIFPNVRYKIIYMDFIERVLPFDSNICLINLLSDKLIHNGLTAVFQDIETFCGELMFSDKVANTDSSSNKLELSIKGFLNIIRNSEYHGFNCRVFRKFCSDVLINLFFN